MNVLLVEDDPLVRNSIVKILQRGGFTVSAVPNGLAALSELRDQRFSAIITDLKLPFLRGDDFFRQVQEFLNQTGQPCLPKPFEAGELVAAVQRVAAKV
jgi:DNA-binding response OmpR family regulator